jgi:hypothetical protein
MGRRLRTLLDEPRAANEYAVAWDGRDEGGAIAAPGLYFARLEACDFRGTQRVLMLR